MESDAKIVAKLTARLAGHRTFKWVCNLHGETDHYSKGGLCKLCNSKPKSARTIARLAGFKHYTEAQGTQRHVSNDMIVKGVRQERNPARAEARRNGSWQFPGHCALHGPTPFNTMRNQCLQCFNTVGLPRPASTNPLGFYCLPDGTVKECK